MLGSGSGSGSGGDINAIESIGSAGGFIGDKASNEVGGPAAAFFRDGSGGVKTVASRIRVRPPQNVPPRNVPLRNVPDTANAAVNIEDDRDLNAPAPARNAKANPASNSRTRTVSRNTRSRSSTGGYNEASVLVLFYTKGKYFLFVKFDRDFVIG